MTKQPKGKTMRTKFWEKAWVKIILAIISAGLMFGGPTYFLYIFQRLNVPYLILVLISLACFAFGLVLFVSIFPKEKGKGSS